MRSRDRRWPRRCAVAGTAVAGAAAALAAFGLWWRLVVTSPWGSVQLIGGCVALGNDTWHEPGVRITFADLWPRWIWLPRPIREHPGRWWFALPLWIPLVLFG